MTAYANMQTECKNAHCHETCAEDTKGVAVQRKLACLPLQHADMDKGAAHKSQNSQPKHCSLQPPPVISGGAPTGFGLAIALGLGMEIHTSEL